MPSEDSLNAAVAAINATIKWTDAHSEDACAWLEARQGTRQVAAASSVHLEASPSTLG